MYSLTVILNFPDYSKEVTHPIVPSQRQLMEIAQGYLNYNPGLTSAVFTVGIRISEDD